jgi:putative ABC transport system permease protein
MHSEYLKKDIGLWMIYVDADFAQTMQIGMIENDDTTIDASTQPAFLLNRALREKSGWTAATGNSLELFAWSGEEKRTILSGTVAGVTENYFFREVITNAITQRLIMVIQPNQYRYILIRTHPDHTQDIVPDIRALWNEMIPDQVFEYAFLEAKIDQKNLGSQDKIIGFSVITVLPILIACLGLFGLTAFTIDRRIKEIGIRKVLGATVFDIAVLLSREFVRWVVLAALIASPIAYFGLDLLFRQVPYQAPQSPLAYALGFSIILLLALLTVNLLAIRAARANPVDALRSE